MSINVPHACPSLYLPLADHTPQSLNAIVEEYEARTGKEINVTFLPIEELEENLRKDPNDWASRLRLTWAKGEGLVNFGEDCDVDNFEYPEWNPKSVVDIILEQD